MIIISLHKYLYRIHKKKETLLFVYCIYTRIIIFYDITYLTIRIIFSIHVWYQQLRIANIITFFQHHFFWNFIFCLIISISLHRFIFVILLMLCSLMYSPYIRLFFFSSCFTLYVFHTLSMYCNFDLVSCIFVYNSGWCKFERDGRNLLYLIYMLICYLFYSLT